MHVLFFAYILDVAANVNELLIPWTLKPDILPCCLQSVLLRVGRTQISLPLPFCSLLPNSRNNGYQWSSISKMHLLDVPLLGLRNGAQLLLSHSGGFLEGN